MKPLRSLRRSWTWPACARGIAARSLIDKSRRTAGTRIGCADRIGVGQKLLHAARAFDAEVGRGQLQRAGQIALDRQLPGLRVADAEVGIDGEGVGRGGGAWVRSHWPA